MCFLPLKWQLNLEICWIQPTYKLQAWMWPLAPYITIALLEEQTSGAPSSICLSCMHKSQGMMDLLKHAIAYLPSLLHHTREHKMSNTNRLLTYAAKPSRVHKTTFNFFCVVSTIARQMCLFHIHWCPLGGTKSAKPKSLQKGSFSSQFFSALDLQLHTTACFISIGVFMEKPPSKTWKCVEHTLQFTNFFCAVFTTAQ